MTALTIFVDGDPWRDLTAEVLAAGSATAITRSGTAILLDLDRPEPGYRRVPLEGGHRMPFFDSAWLPLGGCAPTLTPCGLVVDHPEYWYRSTRLRLVLPGLHPRWAVENPYGPGTVDAIVAGRSPRSPGHDPGPCAAFYCIRRAASRW